MCPHEHRERIVAAYGDALHAFDGLYPLISNWDLPTPCGEWTLLDLSGHLLAIARYWHGLLDAVEVGEHRIGLPRGQDLAAMNAQDLLALTESDGAERTKLFLRLAELHLERVEVADWDVVLAEWSGMGPLTVGQHSGVAIGEWHVHMWDMARSVGRDHQPNDPWIVAEGNRAIRDIPRDIDPWLAVRTAYGRDPEWTPIGI
jgi:Mycothiol maleylpyruvate isomerase N-terminal domain